MNIVYIDCHDLGDWIGCYDKPWLDTPNLDRLAAEGARFTQHFATAPQCIPSRASLYCGKLPHRCGVIQQSPLGSESRCLARYLSEQGWRTLLLGGLNIPNDPAWAGFLIRQALPESAAEAEDRLRVLVGSYEPWFVHISYGRVHRPYGQSYDPADVDRIPVPPVLPDTLATRRDLASLARNVQELDAQVGLILNALQTHGLLSNTIVVFTTDHGPGLARHKHTVYDAGLRTALLMRLPGGIAANTEHSQLLSHVDLFPTLCELSGAHVPDDLDGRSFVRVLGDPAAVVRTQVFAEMNWARRGSQLCYAPHRCLRTRRYKLIRNFALTPFYLDGDFVARFANGLDELHRWPLFGQPSPPYELYDCAADPWELNDLAADPAHIDLVRDLDCDLARLMVDTGDVALDGRIPSQSSEPVKPQWVEDGTGRYRLNYDAGSESMERPFTTA